MEDNPKKFSRIEALKFVLGTLYADRGATESSYSEDCELVIPVIEGMIQSMEYKQIADRLRRRHRAKGNHRGTR